MARNVRINIDQELERHLDDLIDEVNKCLDDQENSREDAIADLQLQETGIYKLAAQVMEVLYFDDGKSVRDSINDAAAMAVNTAIYVGLDKNRDLDRIGRSLEDELRQDYDDVQDIRDAAEGGRSNSRDNRGGGRSGRDSRREAASGDTRRTRRSRNDDAPRRTRTREERAETDNSAEARRKRRESSTNQADEARDNKVAAAQGRIETNAQTAVTSDYVLKNPTPFCSENKNLPLAPVYWLGSQHLMVVDNQVKAERSGENVEWEKHRTDLYLAIRNSVAPSNSERDSALARAIQARDKFVEETIEKLKDTNNVVEEKKETDFKQVLKSSEVAGKFYGLGTPMAKIQTCLKPLGLKFLPKHPVIMKVEQYPGWVMSKALTEAVEVLLQVTNLDQLVPALIGIMNNSDADQWAYFHDKVTNLINVILKVELEARPYLTSVITEWNSFAGWLEKHDNGSMVIWFKNNFNHFIAQHFHVYKNGSASAHALVDGTDEKYASVSITQNIIYLPTDSENFGAACPTKLGRVLESVTPKLYQLLSANVDETAENILVTSSDEQVSVYKRASSVANKVIFMGEVNW